jgi:hypothetical protein
MCSFENAILRDYKEPLEAVFATSDVDWLMGILQRELNVEETQAVFHDNYLGA